MSHGDWSKTAVNQRCRVIASVASWIAENGENWTRYCKSAQRIDPVETITGELFPLCSALRFIGDRGPALLKTKRLGWWGRPIWLWGVQSEIRHQPHGKVLVLGTWNYPLFLVGVQTAQALAAGNDVCIKPAIGCEEISDRLADAFYACGVPQAALQVLDSSTEAATGAIEQGVDLIVLTGSASTGRTVLRQASKHLTPAIMELSGCDAVIVLPQSNLERTAESVLFGLNFNSGATCLGPRRIIIQTADAPDFINRMIRGLKSGRSVQVHPAARESVAATVERAIEQGAKDCLGRFDGDLLRTTGELHPVLLDHVQPEFQIASADVFAPVLSILRVRDTHQAVDIVNNCRYRLSASIFGPELAARQIARSLNVGSVTINDLIVPTADPRVPFGGRGDSGYGVTRGGEGLLAMTVPMVTGVRRGRFMPHLRPRRKSDAQTLLGALQLQHASSLRKRWNGLKSILTAQQRRSGKDSNSDPSH